MTSGTAWYCVYHISCMHELCLTASTLVTVCLLCWLAVFDKVRLHALWICCSTSVKPVITVPSRLDSQRFCPPIHPKVQPYRTSPGRDMNFEVNGLLLWLEKLLYLKLVIWLYIEYLWYVLSGSVHACLVQTFHGQPSEDNPPVSKTREDIDHR